MRALYPRIYDNVLRELKQNEDKIATLARLSGLSYRYIRAVTIGEIKEPSFRRLCHLASYLGIMVTSEPCKHILKEKA